MARSLATASSRVVGRLGAVAVRVGHLRRQSKTPDPFSVLLAMDPVLGELIIRTTDGKTTAIAFHMGKEPLNYSISQKDYVRGGQFRPIVVGGHEDVWTDEGFAMRYLLDVIRQEANDKGSAQEVQEWFVHLARSAGKMPPEDKSRPKSRGGA